MTIRRHRLLLGYALLVSVGLLLVVTFGMSPPATTPEDPLVGRSGPLEVVLMPAPDAVNTVCENILGKPAGEGYIYRGCAGTYPNDPNDPNGSSLVVCQTNDADCLAHEFHHLLDPSWKHE